MVRERLINARRQRSEAFIREVFDRHSIKTTDCPDGKLRGENLKLALRELGFLSNTKTVPTDIDPDRDEVDYEKWRAVESVPTPVESWTKRVPWWQVIADVMPKPAGTEDDPLRLVARLTAEDLDAVCSVVAEEMSRELREQICNLGQAFEQLDRRKEDTDASGASTKFQTYKANAGNADDFYKGLGNRIGTNTEHASTACAPKRFPLTPLSFRDGGPRLQSEHAVLVQAPRILNFSKRCTRSTVPDQGLTTCSRRQTTTL